MTKQCSTCVHWEKQKNSATIGDCVWIYRNKVPVCIYTLQPHMFSYEGTTCPCWKCVYKTHKQ